MHSDWYAGLGGPKTSTDPKEFSDSVASKIAAGAKMTDPTKEESILYAEERVTNPNFPNHLMERVLKYMYGNMEV